MQKNGKTILLIEDDEFIGDAYREALSQGGYNVVSAGDGNSGLSELKKVHPDIVLLDLLIPEKSGFEVLEEIQKHEELKKIPIIVCSNLGQDDDLKKARELGATDYIIKSNFSIDELIKKIERYL